MSHSIFDLSAEAQALNEIIESHLTETQGELTPEAEVILNEWLSDTKTSIDAKLDAYAAVISERSVYAAARHAESARYAALAQTDDNTVRSLKMRLAWFFDSQCMTKHETFYHKFTLAHNGGVLPLVIDEVDADELPDELTKRVISKPAAREFLEAGGSLDWARLGERGRSIRIK